MEDFPDKHRHEKKEEVHIVFDNELCIKNNSHYDTRKILDAINTWHEYELDFIVKQIKRSIKDLKRTPLT